VPSLIQQRIALDRERAIATLLIVAGGVSVILGILTVVTRPDGLAWVTAVWPMLLLGFGLFRLWAYRQSRKAFEAEHGADAGRQPVVGR
jgi:hypothetical protein